MARYGLMSRPMLSEEPRVMPKYGTPAHDVHMAQALEEHHISQLQQAKENKDGQGMNWQTSRSDSMEPEWTKW